MAAKKKRTDDPSETSATAVRRGRMVAVHLAVALALLGAGFYAGARLGPRLPLGHSDDLKPFVESYFAAWSEANIEAYGRLFHPHARIMFVRNNKVEWSLGKTEFLSMQRAFQKQHPSKETMISFQATEHKRVATVKAGYHLVEASGREVIGTDRFTLHRNAAGQWEILFLVFYPEVEKGRPEGF